MNDIINYIFFDEFAGYNLEKRRRPRKIKPRINYLELFDDVDFRSRFRISKNHFMILFEKIEDEIRPKTDCNDAIPPITQLLVALRFYATGSFLQTIGDFCGISISSAQRIVHRISNAIAALRNEFIKLPILPEEIRRNEKEFYQTAKFIRIIGCMDIKIL
ncbi:Putative nuclease HARBI1 [Trachymyrmex zeteki]|uniref:Putative nuclease HARBI1 n=1 Tax=Mycetomoellerius zeteki TaxID=64791 RepID=A0A151WZD3_9HYME|nr:PREDICTED: putative nuclease HARBI1 [Trachymyrmex zeteki]KYQ49272.1 Putative nuclease HARBI1 [Trachymyrmex zeteki]KYQ53248.1 Putative nuclease HARBI1 [Trachymyrmex zeteki]